jgi:hypothetical protein
MPPLPTFILLPRIPITRSHLSCHEFKRYGGMTIVPHTLTSPRMQHSTFKSDSSYSHATSSSRGESGSGGVGEEDMGERPGLALAGITGTCLYFLLPLPLLPTPPPSLANLVGKLTDFDSSTTGSDTTPSRNGLLRTSQSLPATALGRVRGKSFSLLFPSLRSPASSSVFEGLNSIC